MKKRRTKKTYKRSGYLIYFFPAAFTPVVGFKVCVCLCVQADWANFTCCRRCCYSETTLGISALDLPRGRLSQTIPKTEKTFFFRFLSFVFYRFGGSFSCLEMRFRGLCVVVFFNAFHLLDLVRN